jgi:hypothetical protein
MSSSSQTKCLTDSLSTLLQHLRVEKGDVRAQVERLRVVGVSNFWSCCITRSEARRNICSQAVFATQPDLVIGLFIDCFEFGLPI